MRVRQVLGAMVVVMAVPAAVWLTPRMLLENAVPAACAAGLALGIVVSWPTARGWLAWAGLVAAGLSLAGTVAIVVSDKTQPPTADIVGPVEVAGLLVLLTMVARWSPLPVVFVAGGALGVAATGWILRFMPATDLLSTVGGCLMWSLGPLVAAAAGSYPRFAAARLRRSVAVARDRQRLQLAHDLHDFIAHDVTGMVAQAQAARFTGGDDPVALRAALERIETRGQEALTAMDTIVEMLRGSPDSAAEFRAVGLKALPDIVEAFRRESQTGSVVLTSNDVALSQLAPEIQLAATRVVVEGLTNVRRHAPTAPLVRIVVEPDGTGQLVIEVSNDRPTTSRLSVPRRVASGTGLLTLTERVRQLGGRLTAGPDHSGGWVVRCEMPIRQDASPA